MQIQSSDTKSAPDRVSVPVQLIVFFGDPPMWHIKGRFTHCPRSSDIYGDAAAGRELTGDRGREIAMGRLVNW